MGFIYNYRFFRRSLALIFSSTFLVPRGTKSCQFLSSAIRSRMFVPENFSRSFNTTGITSILRFSNKVLVNSSFVKTTSYFGTIYSISKVHFSWLSTSGILNILMRLTNDGSIDERIISLLSAAENGFFFSLYLFELPIQIDS